MQEYLQAAEDIAQLIHKGRKYQEKLAGANLAGAFVYWKPETGEFSVRVTGRRQREKRAFYSQELYASGNLPFSSFRDDTNEENGWVLLQHPYSYRPAEQLKKYASFIDTPAKLSLTGALLGGGALFGKSLYDTWDLPVPFKYKLRHALKPTLIAGGVGLLPGLAAGALHSYQTRPVLEDGTRARRPEVGFFRAMGMTEDELKDASPTYAVKKEVEEARRQAFGKRAEVNAFGALERDASLINVDTFNRAIWDDTQSGWIQPDNALLVSSTLEASRPNNSPFTTPTAVMGTLVNAGIGWATSAVVGKTLGALSILSPAGEQKLREIGTWGGIIDGLGGSLH